MQSIWGYKLALKNLQHSAKSFRNTLNQLTNCCTLHDASYWNAIALHGIQSKIIEIMLPFIAPFQRGNDLFTQKEVLSGNKECELYLYKNNCYPFDFLCSVKCSWNAIQINEEKGKQKDDNCQRVCWLWCHASVYKALFDLLSKLSENNSIEVRNESRKFVRYELRGPMSCFVLQAASQCSIPNLMEEKSAPFVADGSIMCSQLVCDPHHYSVSQPFILNNKSKLKQDFVSCNTPSQHPFILINQYKRNNYNMTADFHTYFEETESGHSKREKRKNELFLFPFMMIAKRFYDDSNMKELALRNKIIGWDIIIPIHSTKVKAFQFEDSIKFTSIARFWWKNLHFGGGRVIGYKQKLFMRLEMKSNQLLFPVDYVDSMAGVHYWLKYYKYQVLHEYFNKPKAKRINPFPMYPFSLWPNILLLFQNKDEIQNMELSDIMIKKNLLQIEKYKKEDGDSDIKMDDEGKQLEYLLNYTLWGLKHDCDLINNIKLKLNSDTIESFDVDWNRNKNCKYFIIRDKNMLQNIRNCRLLKQKMDFMNLYNWDESVVNCALLLVNIKMCKKGVAAVGNAMFLNDKLFGYVTNGGYSSVKGCGIGIGIVKLNQFLFATNDKITISQHSNYPKQRHECYIHL